MTSETLILVGALGGSLIGAITTIITTAIIKNYEEKSDARKILYEAAITDWKQSQELALKIGAKKVFPLDAYLIQHSKTYAAIVNNKLTVEDLKKMHEESRKIVIEWLKEDEKTRKEIKELKNNSI